MINLLELVVLLSLLLLGYLFWQWRMQEEFARQHAEALCKRYKLQFLDIARHSGRPRFRPRTGWEATFVFGFSSDSQSRYEATVILMNRHMLDYTLPTYRQSTEPSAEDVSPEATGAKSTQRASEPPRHQFRITYGTLPAVAPWQAASKGLGHQEETTSTDDEIVDAVFKNESPDATPAPFTIDSHTSNSDGLG
ncbi:DUF3301 domain-containing protein [Aliidiomarina sanyensis]|uniref:DUF3301 domain-containing protein n=1 Tax=Aliidiomarina sanyensis TaxID=1249555 RepID=A0A432WR77_9GAMM|nr:DUF3301 domain-containing protein [Aliidiomarina sanyensis]RUO36306.1 hypothetical protein CWE11_00355 [Aliidiomarina sanyensis]